MMDQALVEEIADVFHGVVVVADEEARKAAEWVLGAHEHNAGPDVPPPSPLAIVGQGRTGKSTLLAFVGALVPDPLILREGGGLGAMARSPATLLLYEMHNKMRLVERRQGNAAGGVERSLHMSAKATAVHRLIATMPVAIAGLWRPCQEVAPPPGVEGAWSPKWFIQVPAHVVCLRHTYPDPNTPERQRLRNSNPRKDPIRRVHDDLRPEFEPLRSRIEEWAGS